MRQMLMMSEPARPRLSARASAGPRMGQGKASNSALNAAPPASGEVRHTALPDTFDGIRFEIGRMTKYVEAVRNDPWMAAFAEGVCRSYSRLAGRLGAADGGHDPRLTFCEALDLWCRDHYAYVNDPPNIEVIQTPQRMVKQTMVPAAVIKNVMQPFFEEFAAVAPDLHVETYEPPPIYFGDCDEAVCCYLGLCVAMPGASAEMGAPAGSPPVRAFFRFGGNDGTLHHVWARVNVDGRDIDADHTEPGYKIGDYSKFEAYESVEVPV